MNRTKRPFSNIAGLSMGRESLEEMTQNADLHRLKLDNIQVIAGHNPRGYFDKSAFSPERLAGLMKSIETEGVHTPIWVKRLAKDQKDQYVLIAGERRYRASQLLGLNDIPALVFEADEERAEFLALLENGQREQLSILDESYAGFRLMQRHTGMPLNELIAHLNRLRLKTTEDTYCLEELLRSVFNTGVSVWAQTRAKIFRLSETELQAVWEGHVSFELASLLTKLERGQEREALLQRAIKENLSAQHMRELLANLMVVPHPTPHSQKLKRLLPQLQKLPSDKAQKADELINQLIKQLHSLIQDTDAQDTDTE